MPANVIPMHPQSPAVRGYARHLRAIGRTKDTVRTRTEWLTRALDATNTTPETITPADLEAWMASHEWSRATRRIIVTGWRQFGRWLVENGWRDDDPAVGLTAPSVPSYRARPIPRDVLADALERSHGLTWWLLRIIATTGLRRNEVAGLRGSDVAGGWLTVRGKGGRVRRIPLPDDVAGFLAAKRDGLGLTREQIADRVHYATRGWGPHSIRARYASDAYAATHDLLAVQQLLGHASLATTQVYLGLGDDALILAASAAWAA